MSDFPRYPDGCFFSSDEFKKAGNGQTFDLEDGWQALVLAHIYMAPPRENIPPCDSGKCLIRQKFEIAKKWQQEHPELRHNFDADCSVCGGGANIVFYPPN